MSLTDPCPDCGTECGRGEDWNRAFVHYEPNPNDAQAELEWADEIPEVLHALVCTECGFVIAVIDKEQLDDEEPPSRSDQFRVDRELE